MLEHKVGSKYHKQGESQEILVDQIELGRDQRCQVRFDESFQTVSRRHAAIVRDGDKWKLVQLSDTNSTFLNGRKVQKEWYLQNGDEIQLSVNGPKMGFLIPTGNKATVGSIGLSRRLSLFRQQALRPYKQAITALAAVLVLFVAGGIYFGYTTQDELQKKSEQIASLIDKADKNATLADSLARQLVENNQKQKDYERKIASLSKRIANYRPPQPNGNSTGGIPATGGIATCNPYVFAIIEEKLVLTDPNGPSRTVSSVSSVIGSGFLLDDGRLVTARHVLEYWSFTYFCEQSDEITEFNIWANNIGKVTGYYRAVSCSGKEFRFTSEQCVCNKNSDVVKVGEWNGTKVVVKFATQSSLDWVYYRTGENSGLGFENGLSANLQIGTKLDVLGFPLGRGAESINNISPIYSSCSVARQGLDVNGTIMTSNDNTEPGNSGGPVIMNNNGRYVVVGILSGSTGEKGRVVPISAVH